MAQGEIFGTQPGRHHASILRPFGDAESGRTFGADSCLEGLTLGLRNPRRPIQRLQIGMLGQSRFHKGTKLPGLDRFGGKIEPTRGIDVGAKSEIFQIMSRLAEQGYGIIFVSSELKEVLAMSDRILVLSKGAITAEFDRDEASEEKLVVASAVGHGPTGSRTGAATTTAGTTRGVQQ